MIDFLEYQERALRTDHFIAEPDSVRRFAKNMVECANEVVESIELHSMDTERVREKLGDVLWYIAGTATRCDLSLAEVAAGNLERIEPHNGDNPYIGKLFDEEYPPMERLPRVLQVKFEDLGNGKSRMSTPLASGEDMQLGDVIDSNTYRDDGYRWHDVPHLAYAAILGWSPNLRLLLKRKRKSNPEVDRVEDGARAKDIEESLTSYIFSCAKEERFFEGMTTVPFPILREIKRRVQNENLEVRYRRYDEWQDCILKAFTVHRALKANNGGYVAIDLNKREITYRETLV